MDKPPVPPEQMAPPSVSPAPSSCSFDLLPQAGWMLMSSCVQESLDDIMQRVQNLRRQQVLLFSQIARAAKCLTGVLSENTLLKSEVQALGLQNPEGMNAPPG